MEATALVTILMGSDSDWEVMREAAVTLREFAIPLAMHVTSAHRTPERTLRLINEAESAGTRLFIVGAGAAAHLAGVVAAHTVRPVIGVPLSATDLNGLDALLATVQMPGGIPVATTAIGKPGARNAALLAVQILALNDPVLTERLLAHRRAMTPAVETRDRQLQARLAEL